MILVLIATVSYLRDIVVTVGIREEFIKWEERVPGMQRYICIMFHVNAAKVLHASHMLVSMGSGWLVH